LKKQKDKMHNALLPLVLEYNSMWSKIVDNLDKERETEEDVNNLMDWCVNLLRYKEAQLMNDNLAGALDRATPGAMIVILPKDGETSDKIDKAIQDISMMLENAGF